MQITALGRYKLNKDFTVHGSISVGTLPAGTEITITQIDAEAHKVIGPELGDWHHWEIPAVHACNEYDELKLKATHYDWLLNEARKTGVTVRFVNGGKDMCVSGGIIKESLVDDLVDALQCAQKLLDKDITYVGATAVLPFESHDQAINHVGEARRAIFAALTKAGAQ